jgi:hypothetical protein
MTFWFSSRIKNLTYNTFEKCWSVCERTIFSRISRNTFFFKYEVDYFEFIFNENDIMMNSNRINIIMSWSMIKFFKNIQIFLNFVNFYRRFIARFFQLLASLSNMLKKMQSKIKKKYFLFTKRAKQIFDLFRNVFQYAFILTYFDSKLLIKLKTNAFDYEIVDIIS